jgi:hypothetical protein
MLPRSHRPEYSTTLPSTGKKIKYQPFTVKEEKILILAAESEETDEIANGVANVLNNCISYPTDLKAEDLPLFDITYLFLKARAKSAGEKIKLKVTDPGDPTFTTEHEINIDKIGVLKTEGHTDLIDIDDTTKVKMKYPGIESFNEGIKIDDLTTSIDTITSCISQIITGEEVINASDTTPEELEEWVESLTKSQFSNLIEFFTTMPRLSHTFTIKNTNTGKDFSITLEGLTDFF